MDDDVIVPWVGPNCYKNALSVIVLSSNTEIIEKISEALNHVHARSNYRWKLFTLRSCSLEDVINQTNFTETIAIDFIVIALDTSKIFCLEWARKVLEQVHPDLKVRRVILVNSSGLPPNGMAINTDELLSFQTDFKVDLLNGNVYKEREVTFLARRILKYLEVSVGVKTGIPNLNV